ncbi:MAG: hypothetical protein LBH29_01365, partial [Elusimicrobiota bacterium]|nr:hypothetical protein [Elusimicrobiota bacterium]
MKSQTVAKSVKTAKARKESKGAGKKISNVSAKEKSEKAAPIVAENKTENKRTAYLCIDYPVESEQISASHHYALRIGASNDGYVEISFNGGEWNPCRYSAGYWWFDMLYFKAGDYSLRARMADAEGKTI